MIINTAGEYTLQYTATDACGNSTTVERDLVVLPPPRTVLYTDGTFIINESSVDEAANVQAHGVATNVYKRWGSGGTSDESNYVFNAKNSVLWYNERTLIKAVEVGSIIRPSDMKYWFDSCSNLATFDFENINMEAVRSFRNLFNNCTSLVSVDLSNFDLRMLQDTYMMFYKCSNLITVDFSSLMSNQLVETNSMFRSCNKLETIYVSDSFTTENVMSSNDMFSSMSTKLVGGAGTIWNSSNPTNKTYAHIDGGVSDPGYFTAKS